MSDDGRGGGVQGFCWRWGAARRSREGRSNGSFGGDGLGCEGASARLNGTRSRPG